MKKPYMPKLALLSILSMWSFSQVVAQTMPELQPFTYTHLYSWDTSPFLSFQYQTPSASLMRFRLMLPNGFDRFANDGNKYPIIIFLHGSGESGVYDAAPGNNVGEQDNEKQLVHGGQTHRNAVQNGTFPGLLLYPQIRRPNPASGAGPYWGLNQLEGVEYILRKLIQGYKVDPNRIYVHGLSMGGEGAWRFIAWRPDLFAAAHPMSAAGTAFWKNASSPSGYWTGEGRQRYKHIPLRQGQGGLDTGPRPAEGNTQVDAIREIGGNIRYDYYPTLGHGIWNSEYGKPDFFSWFLSHKKYNIHVAFGQTSFCPGENFSVVLGLTAGFANYQWAKNGVTFLTSTTANEITVTQVVTASSGPGIYTARFQRANGEWTPWSDPVDINNTRGLSSTPTIDAEGQSHHLPALDGSPDITLTGALGKAAYVWKRGSTTLANTTQTIGVNTAGSYTLATRDFGGTGRESDGVTPTEYRATPLGCQSLPSSPVNVTTAGNFGVPAPPANVIAGGSQTSVTISWEDRSSDETGFELFRSTSSAGGYELISVLPATTGANPQTYIDNNLLANTTYFYRMRAINNAGGSSYTPATSGKTVVDIVPPAAPTLSLGASTRSDINLIWTGATDNVAVTEYDIYQNNTLITSTKATTYKVTGLAAFATYSFVVKARDLANNTSAPSNQVNTAAVINGLTFDYYHNNGIPNTSQILVGSTYVKSGTSEQININQRNRDDNFAFIFNGFIIIPTTGAYTFYTSSDDGSTLWINGTRVVNNDNTHGCQERSGNITLSAGTYPIQCFFFTTNQGECLTARWQGPGIAKAEIPASAFKDTYTPPAALNAPSGFSATPVTFNQINLSWADNSSNETGFEIERSLSAGSGYQVVKVTNAGAVSWSDNTLSPSTQYFYRIRALSLTSASSSVGPVNATTSAPPAAPAIPSGLSASVNSPTQVTLNWTDNSATESGFEIQKSSQPGNGFVTIATTTADAVSYIDATANGHSALYYRIRAVADGGVSSAYTSESSVTTSNRAPTITAIIDRNIAIGSSLAFDIQAADPDVEPLTFSFPNGLPAFASFQNNGYGKGRLTFTNAVAGTYNIRAQVSDGINSVFDDFVLVVNTNNAPVLADIPFQSTEAGRTLLITASATDADADVLTYTVSGLPSFCTWSASQRRITARPLAGHAGIYENITINVRDNKVPAGVDTKTFTLIVTPLDQAFTISVNFTETPSHYEEAPWNNTGMPQVAAVTNLKDDQGNVVRFVGLLTTTSWATIAPFVVDLPNASNAVYTEKVRESYYRRSSGGTGNKMKITGLNPAMQYKVTLYGAGGWVTGTPPAGLNKLMTRYMVAGLTTQVLELNTLNNVSNTVTTDLMKPTSGGEISVTVARGTDNLNHFYINAMILHALYDDGSAPSAPTNVVATAPENDRVELTWQDNSINETRFDILRSTTINGVYGVVGTTAANATAFTDNSITGRTSYYYKVRAANLTTGSDSNPQLVTTPNGIPAITTFDAIVGTAGLSFQRTINATDPDGDAITFATLDLPPFATLVDNGNGTGYIQFTPTAAQAGTYNFEVHASDDFEGVSELKTSVIAANVDYSEVVYLNFKGAAGSGDAPAPWNNVVTLNSTTTGIKNINGQNTTVQVKPGINWAGSSNTGGVNTETGLYPTNVLASHWTTTSTSGAVLTLKGLDNTKRYNLALSGSLNQFWFANTVFVVNGVQKTLNTSKNTNRFVKFAGIQPAGDSIVITVRKGANVSSTPVVAQRDGILGSLVLERVTPGATPAKPTNFAAAGASKTSIRLSWTDNSADETGFEIYRATSQGGAFTLINTTTANAESYTNTGLAQNTAYIYRIRAVKAGGSSAYTNDAFARTFNQIILVNVNSSAGSGQLQAAAPWNNLATPPTDALSFSNFKDDTNANTTVGLQVTNWENGGTNNTGFLTGNNSGIYPDAVLENYYYFEQFDAATAYNLTGLNNNLHYDLLFLGNEWNQATTGNLIVATDYTADGVTVSQFNGKNSTETVSVKEVQPDGGIIPFEIKAHDDARYGVWNSIEVRSYTPIGSSFDIIAPSVPQNLVASSITSNSAQLTWSASTDNVAVTGYRIYQNNGTLIKTVATLTTSMTGLTPSTAYVFYVKAIDAAGNESASSKGVKVTTPASGGGRVDVSVEAEEPALIDADIFPNPAREKVVVKFNSAVTADAQVNIMVYSLQGRMIAQKNEKNKAEGIEINTADYNHGLYLMKIDVDGTQLIKKFIRE
jgi:chitodextrinase/predicted esterase